MSKIDQLERLFERWIQSNKEYKSSFVKDGIINENIWETDSPKVLFITKEPNQRHHQQAADFRTEWNDGDHDYMFAKRIAEWTYGIYHMFEEPFNKLYNDKDAYGKYLLKVALLNIKKSGGGPVADNNVITQYYEKNKTHIIEQISIIDPSIIIICLSWNEDISKELFAGATWQNTGYNIFIGTWRGKKIIDFYHPSSRTPPAASFSLLKDIFLSETFKKL